MSTFVFPDNTVLCNFGVVDRLGLLCSALRGRGRWTEAVAYEAHRSSRTIPPLAALPSAGWLGEPIEMPDPAEADHVDRIRRAVFGGIEAEPLRHLGEAQTCVLIQSHSEFQDAWWVSDDRDALEYARRQGITTRETIDVVAMSVADGDLSGEDAFRLMHSMADQGRTLRLPVSPADLTR